MWSRVGEKLEIIVCPRYRALSEWYSNEARCFASLCRVGSDRCMLDNRARLEKTFFLPVPLRITVLKIRSVQYCFTKD